MDWRWILFVFFCLFSWKNRATNNKKLRETVALELSFVNSNLQLLKEQLAELNSSVEVYQDPEYGNAHIPMIPLGLKETKEVPFQDPLQVGFDVRSTRVEFPPVTCYQRQINQKRKNIEIIIEMGFVHNH